MDIRKMTSEGYVTTCPVVGMHYVSAIDDLMPYVSEGVVVRLVRERDNPHDSHAVAVCLKPQVSRGRGDRLGYVSRKNNLLLATLMDCGVELEGVVTDVCGKRGFPTMKILVSRKQEVKP